MIPFLNAISIAAGVSTGPTGQQLFTANGSFVVPDDVYSICVVVITRGGEAGNDGTTDRSGAGGGLAYANNVSVTPGENLSVRVAAGQGIISDLRRGGVALCSAFSAANATPGYGVVGDVVRSGGAGASRPYGTGTLSGAGCAGYTSNGQDAGGGSDAGGGGTSPLGGGGGALAGASPLTAPRGENYGGGTGQPGASFFSQAGAGCIRIIWGDRAFPNTNTGDL